MNSWCVEWQEKVGKSDEWVQRKQTFPNENAAKTKFNDMRMSGGVKNITMYEGGTPIASDDGLAEMTAEGGDANTTKQAAILKIQDASKERLLAALNHPNTDPAVKKLIERELDDRADRGS